MKKFVAVLLVVVFLSGCARSLVINDYQVARPYGLLNQHEKYTNVEYDVSWPNVALGLFLVYSLVVPVYVIGFGLMEPVGAKIERDMFILDYEVEPTE